MINRFFDLLNLLVENFVPLFLGFLAGFTLATVYYETGCK